MSYSSAPDCPAAAGLPDWKSLLESMVTEIENDGAADEGAAELRALIEGGKLLDVADHCRQRLGERRYQELLGEKLRGGSGDIPEIHRFVTQLPFSAIVTTNYDKLLERASLVFAVSCRRLSRAGIEKRWDPCCSVVDSSS